MTRTITAAPFRKNASAPMAIPVNPTTLYTRVPKAVLNNYSSMNEDVGVDRLVEGCLLWENSRMITEMMDWSILL